MKNDSILILNSNDVMPTNADGIMGFKQNSDLFYLTGIDQEETTLILEKSETNSAYLFLRETSDLIKVWEGAKLSIQEAQNLSGINNCEWNTQLPRKLKSLTDYAKHIYLNSNEHSRADSLVQTRDQRFIEEYTDLLQTNKRLNATTLLYQNRFIKESEEVHQMQNAMHITRDAFLHILPKFKHYKYEFEIEADITHQFLLNRSRGHAYQPIIAGGKNACVLHYTSNNNKLNEGDLVLMDFGAEYGNYNADLTRTIPVSGSFSPRQKEIYNAVLEVLEAATKELVAGNTWPNYNKSVKQIMDRKLIELGLLSEHDIKTEDPAKPAMRKYFMHGTSHSLGLDVHDVDNRSTPFANGMIFTVEPGIYIEEEGIGIRLENNVLITANGPKNMMSDIPITIDEIEKLMK